MQYQNFNSDYVRRLIDGDADTERHFVTYFSELLLIKVRRTLHCRQAMEDVRQETFLRVFSVLRSKGGIEYPERLGAFVYGVCSNVLAEYYRSSSRFANNAQQDMAEAATGGSDPEAHLVTEERKRRVREVLNELPAKDRQILRLIFFEEIEKEEVCRLYQIDRNYLRVLVHRAKNRFRAVMSSTRALAPARAVAS